MLHNIRLVGELGVTPAEAYAMYLDPDAHGRITGGPVEVAAREGAQFYAFGGALSGHILHLVPGRRIVQTWRSDAFGKADADSILVLTFLPKGRQHTLVDVQQLNVPARDCAGVSHGWESYYFAPWRKYIADRKRRHEERAEQARQNALAAKARQQAEAAA